MSRQLSTSISDLFLSLTCLVSCYDIFKENENVFLIYGLLLVGLASTAGIFKFSGCDSVKDLHRGLSAHAAAVGLPWTLLIFASIQLNQGSKLALVSAGWDIFVILGMHVCTTQYENTSKMLVPATLLGLVYSAIVNNNRHLLLAAAGLVLTAICGATGKIGPFQRVDIFHYILCGVVYALRTGIIAVV